MTYSTKIRSTVTYVFQHLSACFLFLSSSSFCRSTSDYRGSFTLLQLDGLGGLSTPQLLRRLRSLLKTLRTANRHRSRRALLDPTVTRSTGAKKGGVTRRPRRTWNTHPHWIALSKANKPHKRAVGVLSIYPSASRSTFGQDLVRCVCFSFLSFRNYHFLSPTPIAGYTYLYL